RRCTLGNTPFSPRLHFDRNVSYTSGKPMKETGLLTTAIVVLAFAMSSFSQSTPPGQFAELPGVRLRYIDTGGNGIPVVFLHSNTGSSANWEHQIPVFTSAHFRFIAYDRRGWGRSVTEPAAPVGTGADDLHALMSHLKIDRFHLVATAGGGFVALDYALSFPQQL